MAAAHLDIHLLGSPESIDPALARVRKAACVALNEDPDEILGDPVVHGPSAPPWPVGFPHASQGVVSLSRAMVMYEIVLEKVIAAALEGQGVECAAVVFYSTAGDGVHLALGTHAKPDPDIASLHDESQVAPLLGMPLYQAMSGPDPMEDIADRVLPALLAHPVAQGYLAPLFAVDHAQRLDERLPAVGLASPRPRV